ncbi:hypothetical protein B0H10DRAFT_1939249 [Mycena sp. CBHHK59/15]|nr:hypothetical protein B0H10DRAFT_1939249 [Mycena sp. CBHHK59/15]
MSGHGSISPSPYTPAGMEGQPEIIKKCQDIVQEFRNRKITKIMHEAQPWSLTSRFWTRLKRSSTLLPGEAAAVAEDQGGVPALLLRMEDPVIESAATAGLTKTRNQLVEYSKDPKYVLSTLLNSTNHISFPESEWSAIVKGQAVKLDKVITSHYSVSHKRQHAETIGERVQLLFGPLTPQRSFVPKQIGSLPGAKLPMQCSLFSRIGATGSGLSSLTTALPILPPSLKRKGRTDEQPLVTLGPVVVALTKRALNHASTSTTNAASQTLKAATTPVSARAEDEAIHSQNETAPLLSLTDNMSLYKPYNRLLPALQTENLELWDNLRVLHDDPKQEWGFQLPIISVDVDPI